MLLVEMIYISQIYLLLIIIIIIVDDDDMILLEVLRRPEFITNNPYEVVVGFFSIYKIIRGEVGYNRPNIKRRRYYA